MFHVVCVCDACKEEEEVVWTSCDDNALKKERNSESFSRRFDSFKVVDSDIVIERNVLIALYLCFSYVYVF